MATMLFYLPALIYSSILDWQMYDNSDVGSPQLIASKINKKLRITDHRTWDTLVELYNET